MKENPVLDNASCASCGMQQASLFCEYCGERRIDAKQRSLVFLLSDLFEGFVSLENRLFRSISSFLLRPGELSRNYAIGKRVQYVKPITFFLMINLLYVLLTPLTDFNVSFYDQLNSQPYSDFVKPIVLEQIERYQFDLKAVQTSYEQVTAVLSRSLIIMSTPLLAVLIALIYRRKDLLFVDHLVYSIYLYAWIMTWIILAQVPSYFLSLLDNLIDTPFALDQSYLLVLFLGVLLYSLLASRRSFQLTWFSSLWRLPMTFAAIMISHFCYRFLQLFLSLWIVLMEFNL